METALALCSRCMRFGLVGVRMARFVALVAEVGELLSLVVVVEVVSLTISGDLCDNLSDNRLSFSMVVCLCIRW